MSLSEKDGAKDSPELGVLDANGSFWGDLI